MKKLLIGFLMMTLLLTGCARSAKEEVDEQTGKTEYILQTSDQFETQGMVLRFNGFVHAEGEGWIVSFSRRHDNAVNMYYWVKENSDIRFNEDMIRIVKLEPEKNKITVVNLTKSEQDGDGR